MITLQTLDVQGFYPAIHGMRNPKNSWDKQDSFQCEHFHSEACYDCKFHMDGEGCLNPEPYADDIDYFVIGSKDEKLAMRLVSGGPVHAKFRRMIAVYVDITAPLYWWKEFDTYKVGTVANSCSTMHTLHTRDLTLDDFSKEHLFGTAETCLQNTIDLINEYRRLYIKQKDTQDGKDYWWQMIQLLPTSFNQKRTVMLNYEVLANICYYRRGHKLDEWYDFIRWANGLPHSELFMGGNAK